MHKSLAALLRCSAVLLGVTVPSIAAADMEMGAATAEAERQHVAEIAETVSKLGGNSPFLAQQLIAGQMNDAMFSDGFGPPNEVAGVAEFVTNTIAANVDRSVGENLGVVFGKECGIQYGANFEVPFGGYSGDEVISVQTRSLQAPRTDACFNVVAGAPRSNHVGNRGGWNFEPGSILIERWQTIDVMGQVYPPCSPANPVCETTCSVVIRYVYVGRGGSFNFIQDPSEPALCSFKLQGQFTHGGSIACDLNARKNCQRPKLYRSTNGQAVLDLSDPNVPVVRFADGSTETMGRQPDTGALAFGMNLPRSAPDAAFPFGRDHWMTATKTDRNGVRTTLEYSDKGWVNGVVDGRGIRTSFERDEGARVTAIVRPGARGIPRRWSMTWTSHSLDVSKELGDKVCLLPDSFGNCDSPSGLRAGSCAPVAMTVLDRVELPDGRDYRFAYNDLGSLREAISPSGAVTQMGYGGDATTSHWPSTWDQRSCPGRYTAASALGGPLPYEATVTKELLKHRLVTTTIYPLGTSGPAHASSVAHEPIEERLPFDAEGKCGRIQWRRETMPDGTSKRFGLCLERSGETPAFTTEAAGYDYAKSRCSSIDHCRTTFSTNLNGVLFEEQVYAADGTLVSKSTYGDWATMTPFRAWERWQEPNGVKGRNGLVVSPVGSARLYLDIRPTRIIHETDGAIWEEQLEYEESEIPPYPFTDSPKRTTGNITVRRVKSGAVALYTATTKYLRDEDYVKRNLIRLPVEIEIRGGTSEVLSLTTTTYDGSPLLPSKMFGLDTSVGVARGNATTITRWADPTSRTRPITAQTEYYDTGTVHAMIDPRGATTTSNVDLEACTADHALAKTTTTSPPPGGDNMQKHVTVTTADCFTGVVLSVLDPNLNTTCMQTDLDGRIVETAQPGDALSLLPESAYARDPACPTTASSVLGSGGQGPATWIERFDESIPGQRRVVKHTKNGVSNGHVSIEVSDGLDRAVQVCTANERSSSTNCGAECDATCTVVQRDEHGRSTTESVAFFSAMRSSLGPIPSPIRIKSKTYDALSRVTREELMGSGIPAVKTGFGSRDGLFLVTTTDPGGHVTYTLKNALAHVLRIERQADGGKFLTTTMEHDALGRLLRVTGPGGDRETTRFILDGLGRRTKMIDGDLGTWSFGHDANGNVTSKTDARNRVTTFEFDALNRVVRKTLPAGSAPDNERVIVTTYDGIGAAGAAPLRPGRRPAPRPRNGVSR